MHCTTTLKHYKRAERIFIRKVESHIIYQVTPLSTSPSAVWLTVTLQRFMQDLIPVLPGDVGTQPETFCTKCVFSHCPTALAQNFEGNWTKQVSPLHPPPFLPIAFVFMRKRTACTACGVFTSFLRSCLHWKGPVARACIKLFHSVLASSLMLHNNSSVAIHLTFISVYIAGKIFAISLGRILMEQKTNKLEV